MPKGDKSQTYSEKMTLNILQGYGAFVVVRKGQYPLHGEGTQFTELQNLRRKGGETSYETNVRHFETNTM